MTTRIHLLGAAAAASALLLLPVASVAAPAEPTQRAAKSFDTLQKMEGAKHQACRKPIPGTDKIRVSNRVVNDGLVDAGARMKVLRDGKGIHQNWSSGYVSAGDTSSVGSVVVPKGGGYTLDVALFQRQAGGGDNIRLASIGVC